MAPKRKTDNSTLILFVRHGRTPTTGKVLPGRSMNLHLSDEGITEAGVVAKRIASTFDIDALYTSPITRAKETASPIGKAVGKKPIIQKGLLEANYGDWTGRALSDVGKLPEWKWVQSNIGTFRFPNGESFLEMQARVDESVIAIHEEHPGKTVVAVSHADPIKVAVVTALQAPLQSIQSFEVATASVTAIRYDGRYRSVLAVSDTADFKGIR